MSDLNPDVYVPPTITYCLMNKKHRFVFIVLIKTCTRLLTDLHHDCIVSSRINHYLTNIKYRYCVDNNISMSKTTYG